MKQVVEIAERAVIPILGQDAVYPVRRVYCIAQNYAAHTREMGHDPEREAPFFFQKNPDDLNVSGVLPYPSRSRNVHHEVELALLLGSGGHDIAEVDAQGCIWGYATALDMTRRDLQLEQKKLGRPWEVAKAFDQSAPIGSALPKSEVADISRSHIRLTVNGELRQDGQISQMIWQIPEIIAILSTYFTLAAGDVILTGTPAGVGPVEHGDRLEAHIEGLPPLAVMVG